MNLQTAIPIVLRDMRSAAGIDQRELGRRTGLSNKSVSGYEVGRTVPHLRNLERMVMACGKTLPQFFTELESVSKGVE